MPVFTDHAVLLAKVESTPGTDAAPTSSDAIWVFRPSYQADVRMDPRNTVRADWSQDEHRITTKSATISFELELVGSGTADTAPAWATLLKGCGMVSSSVAAISKSVGGSGAVRVSGITTFTTTAAHGLSTGQYVTISGTTDTTFNGTFLILSAPTTTTFTVYNAGTNATSGNSTVARAGGAKYSTSTTGGSSLTLWLYYKNKVHKLRGAMGTCTISGEAGSYGRVNFSFIGTFTDPATASPPTPAFTQPLPTLIENACLTAGSEPVIVSKFSFGLGNTTNLVSDSSATNGYRRARIVNRSARGGIDPEFETTETFWSKYTSATVFAFGVKIGTIAGKMLLIEAPFSQITSLGYADRGGFRTFDLGMTLRRGPSGNDEFSVLFD